MTTWLAAPSGPLRGEIEVPGDKSISHRAALLTALATGDSRIENYLEAEDTLATLAALGAVGVEWRRLGEGSFAVGGVGLKGLQAPAADLDCGNSGTAMRLLAGVLAAQPFASRLVGDASLSRRPMERILKPLRAMGAKIEATAGCPPLSIEPADLKPIDYKLPVASAQVKSCLLLAGLCSGVEVNIAEPVPTRDHSERMLRHLGAAIEVGGGRIRLSANQQLRGGEIGVAGDISSALFFLVAALLCPGSDLVVRGVGLGRARTGALEALRAMGAQLEVLNHRQSSGEPVADLRARHSSLSAIDLDGRDAASMIDEYPLIFVAAAAARGHSRFTGLGELRHKESDRLASMAQALAAVGIGARIKGDGMEVEGGLIAGGTIDAVGDHRVAMSMSVAGLVAAEPVRIEGCAAVATSFPHFADRARALGWDLQEIS